MAIQAENPQPDTYYDDGPNSLFSRDDQRKRIESHRTPFTIINELLRVKSILLGEDVGTLTYTFDPGEELIDPSADDEWSNDDDNGTEIPEVSTNMPDSSPSSIVRGGLDSPDVRASYLTSRLSLDPDNNLDLSNLSQPINFQEHLLLTEESLALMFRSIENLLAQIPNSSVFRDSMDMFFRNEGLTVEVNTKTRPSLMNNQNPTNSTEFKLFDSSTGIEMVFNVVSNPNIYLLFLSPVNNNWISGLEGVDNISLLIIGPEAKKHMVECIDTINTFFCPSGHIEEDLETRDLIIHDGQAQMRFQLLKDLKSTYKFYLSKS